MEKKSFYSQGLVSALPSRVWCLFWLLIRLPGAVLMDHNGLNLPQSLSHTYKTKQEADFKGFKYGCS